MPVSERTVPKKPECGRMTKASPGRGSTRRCAATASEQQPAQRATTCNGSDLWTLVEFAYYMESEDDKKITKKLTVKDAIKAVAGGPDSCRPLSC